ncbi:MAG: MOSC N-terminal beta barrel domain-containing protein [Gammaproteobacteria bacterium]|nr:MOSC N-terminal beta barrel domain-containing protein [Gammaproteobacteria bacterium]
MIQVTDIYIYPVKSLKGIQIMEAEAGMRGLRYDREWMITDSDYQFLTQREIEAMATITVSVSKNCLLIQSIDGDELKVDLNAKRNGLVKVSVWDDTCDAYDEGEVASYWLTDKLGYWQGRTLRLVRFSSDGKRPVPAKYLLGREAESAFSDQFPFLITSWDSLEKLNEGLVENGKQEVTMDRFRPNIVIGDIDGIENKTLLDLVCQDGNYEFGLRKPCKRCKITTINQNSGEIIDFKEPLATLTSLGFSDDNYGAYFGQNAILLSDQNCIISVGDVLQASTKSSDN